ncbi:MAG: F0F1 ATP synthase subunit B [Ruminococcus sp.]|nr:F0F1 ATP synthase subunit B [Ruminococcus sp.]MBR6623904.1 F0F1 ATP synthase subunit B [Ruminococcus sp.]
MLDIDHWNFIWAAVNFILLFILLKIFLFKPVNKIMDERTRTIQDDLDAAKKSKEEAEALKKEYEDNISDAKQKAQEIIMKAHEDAESEKSAILKKSQEEADQLISDANKTIENERKRVLAQAQTQIADLAIEAASKIIGENLDDEKNRRLVDKFLSDEEVES